MLCVVMVRVVLFSSDPWDKWVYPDLHGFYKWVLYSFLKQVVVNRRDIGIRKWASWLREDSGSRPYAWLRLDFVPLFSISCRQGPSDPVISDFS